MAAPAAADGIRTGLGQHSNDPALDCRQYFDIFTIMKQPDVLRALAALAQESRLAVFRLLVKRGPDGYTPGEISELLGIPAPTLSFHLKELSKAGLLSVHRRSRFMHYEARFDRMSELLAYLTENCCSLGSACDTECAPKGRKVASTTTARGRRVPTTKSRSNRDHPHA